MIAGRQALSCAAAAVAFWSTSDRSTSHRPWGRLLSPAQMVHLGPLPEGEGTGPLHVVAERQEWEEQTLRRDHTQGDTDKPY